MKICNIHYIEQARSGRLGIYSKKTLYLRSRDIKNPELQKHRKLVSLKHGLKSQNWMVYVIKAWQKHSRCDICTMCFMTFKNRYKNQVNIMYKYMTENSYKEMGKISYILYICTKSPTTSVLATFRNRQPKWKEDSILTSL